MKILKSEYVEEFPLYDITVDDVHNFVLDNGIVAHNSSMYPRAIVSGGTGIYYSADDVWIIGRQQEKVKTEITGYNFIINVDKSRTIREKSKIPINVTFEGGLKKWSGMFELALALGYITSEKMGWYNAIDVDTGEIFTDKSKRKGDLEHNDEFWEMMFEKTDIKNKIEKNYAFGGKALADETVLADESGLND